MASSRQRIQVSQSSSHANNTPPHHDHNPHDITNTADETHAPCAEQKTDIALATSLTTEATTAEENESRHQFCPSCRSCQELETKLAQSHISRHDDNDDDIAHQHHHRDNITSPLPNDDDLSDMTEPSCPTWPAPQQPNTSSTHITTPRGDMEWCTTNLSTSTKVAAPDSKYQSYHLLVDRTQDDKAIEIALFTAKRPHMRAFHFAWISFFVAFFNWFAISPLLSEVATTLHLTKEQIWTSSICAVAGTAVVRASIGPYCDKYGSRVCSVVTLVVSGIPALALGFVQGSVGLSVLRLVIGVGGATFVTGQYWTSSMFTTEVVGTANALVAGWGNLGGGVTQVVMGSILFPLFKWMFSQIFPERVDQPADAEEMGVAELAWRTVMLVPGIMALVTAYVIFRYSDDSPKGNYEKRTRTGDRHEVNTCQAMCVTLKDPNTWLLFLQYACCFGVEITMSNAAALYFKHEFGMTTEKAAAVASVFGWMNLFARGFGGFISDISNAWRGMQGRLIWHFITLLFEGITVIIFASSRTLGGAICAMCIFSIFVQAAEGSTYGIVPYVQPKVTGSIAGLVGAGGTVGGVIFSILFRQYDYRKAFVMVGYSIIASSLLTGFIFIKGHRGCMCGKDDEELVLRTRMNQLRDQAMEEPQDRIHDLEEGHNQEHIVQLPMDRDLAEENETPDEVSLDSSTKEPKHHSVDPSSPDTNRRSSSKIREDSIQANREYFPTSSSLSPSKNFVENLDSVEMPSPFFTSYDSLHPHDEGIIGDHLRYYNVESRPRQRHSQGSRLDGYNNQNKESSPGSKHDSSSDSHLSSDDTSRDDTSSHMSDDDVSRHVNGQKTSTSQELCLPDRAINLSRHNTEKKPRHLHLLYQRDSQNQHATNDPSPISSMINKFQRDDFVQDEPDDVDIQVITAVMAAS